MTEPSRGAKVIMLVVATVIAALLVSIVIGGLAWAATTIWQAVLG